MPQHSLSSHQTGASTDIRALQKRMESIKSDIFLGRPPNTITCAKNSVYQFF